MRILRHYDGVPDDVRGCAIVLGNFDGVHRGHQEVIGSAVADAAAQGRSLAVVTFEPHPRSFFAPGQPPFRLTPFRSKAMHLAALKVDVLMVLAFNEDMSQVVAEDFVQRVLIDGIGVTHVTVGYDFRFGNGRRGDVDLLSGMAADGGFTVNVVQPVASADGEVYSSTRIRDYRPPCSGVRSRSTAGSSRAINAAAPSASPPPT